MEDRELLDALWRTPELGMKTLMEQYAGLVYAAARSRLPENVFCAADVEGGEVMISEDGFPLWEGGADKGDRLEGEQRTEEM